MGIDWNTLQIYVAAAVFLVLVPGPDSLLILSRSVFEGRNAGWIANLGTSAGNVVHAGLAALGISAVIAASPMLFDLVRWLGAAYLAWLGVRALAGAYRSWRDPGGSQVAQMTPPARWQRNISHAFLTNLLNPKVILFYLAFVPQFVSPAHGSVALQTFLLGLVLAGMAALYHIILAAGAAGVARQIVHARWFRITMDAASGLVFIGFALRVFLTERKAA